MAGGSPLDVRFELTGLVEQLGGAGQGQQSRDCLMFRRDEAESIAGEASDESARLSPVHAG